MIRQRAILILLGLFLCLSGSLFAQGSAESKIKNGRLLAEKALTMQGEARADYIYKAKREFERALVDEPKNPSAYYWESVIAYYLEHDSTAADKLYSKALQYADKTTKDFPPPWTYRTDDNLKSAFAGEFAWAVTPSAPVTIAEKPEKPKPSEKQVDPLETLSSFITAENFISAESLYAFLNNDPNFHNKQDLLLSGLKLKLSEDSLSQATDILDNIQKSSNRRSKFHKESVEIYDSFLDPVVTKAKQNAQRGETATAYDALMRWDAGRETPVTPARGEMLLLAASLKLSVNDTTSVNTILALYESSGYDKNDIYKDLKSRSASPKKEKPKETQLAEKPPAVSLPKIAPKAQSADNIITVFPPGSEIVKVQINTIDPATGQVKSTDLWETASPLSLKTGSAYKIIVQKKQERIAPRYIALAAMLATFLIVR